ncbi:orotate phosphoribosyltransferase [Fundicoccus culcitae]|uniref:Orotate phosphoribosyltransferase n=1 Tax=Fundicoccus culcitae TaxID=2969821 RepID=A0ABY5P393_9LACT|nr:orotate phosphoribosyltransferase [Fundicoccus culcitae]UUX33189.1 orotate phosphoribosyltransferase [Fundicoccus culcitae]
MNQASNIAELLLAINAVNLNPTEPYTWASGIKAPIYCDNRLIMSYPKERDQIETALAELIMHHYPDVEVIAGTATAGIPHAAFVAAKLNLPMIYVRSSNKDHGKQKAIEGYLEPGAKVVMIEDLISTGSSVLKAAEKVTEAGGDVLGCVAIFDYLLEVGRQNFAAAQLPLATLTNYQILIDAAVKRPELANHYDTLASWYQNPSQWPNQ